MAISERVSPDNLNIHQFQEVPEARPDIPFDAEQYFTTENLAFVASEMKMALKASPEYIEGYAYYASLFKRLRPNEELPVTVPKKQLLAHLKKIQEGSDLSVMSLLELDYLKDLMVIYPDGSLVDKEKLDNLLEMEKQKLKEISTDAAYYLYVKNIMAAKLIEPKHAYVFTPEEKESIDKALNYYFVSNLDVYAQMAAQVKIIDPSFDLKLTLKHWDAMSDAVKLFAGSMAYEMAYNMKILATYKVEITSPGVIEFQIYPPGDLNQSTPPMPETRKF